MKKKSPVRLYRFWNIMAEKFGEPFELCDGCVKNQVIPHNCMLSKLANKAVETCVSRREEMGR